MAERRQLRTGPDGSQDPARALGGAVLVGGLAREACAGLGELGVPIADAVLPQRRQVRPEGVGLDEVGTCLEVGTVDGQDDVRPAHVEDLVAALVALEVVHRRVLRLQHRPHGTVGDEDTGTKDRA